LVVLLQGNWEGLGGGEGAYMSAFSNQSKSSSPSSDPPGPPWTLLKYLGCHSMPCSFRLAVSSRCRSSIFDFSSVAAVWSEALIACTVLYHSFWDSRSSCSSSGRAIGGVCREFVALKRISFWPVWYIFQLSEARMTCRGLLTTTFFAIISPLHMPDSS